MFKGSFLGQIIGIIGTLILAKIYGPQAYGFYGNFISFSSIIAIIYTLQLENAIIISKTKNKAIKLAKSLLIITVVLTIAFGIIYSLITFNFSNFKELKIIGLISITASFFVAFNKIQESLLTNFKKFNYLSYSKIIIAICNISFQYILYDEFKLFGLIYGNIIAIILISLYYSLKNGNEFKIFKLQFNKKSILEHHSIIKFIFPSTLINSIAINIIPILIVLFFGAKEAGIYFLSLKILTLPLTLISSSISTVYFEKANKLFHYSKSKLLEFTSKIVITNIILMFFVLVFINSIGIFVLEYILNTNWENLKLYTLILSFLILSRSCFNPISSIIIVLEKNRSSLIFNIYLIIINIGSLLIGYFLSNFKLTLICITIFGSIGYISLLIYFLLVMKKLNKL